MSPVSPLDASTALAARLAAHRLRGPDLPDVPAAVGHLLAVQGQELHPALWGLSRRVTPVARPGTAAASALVGTEVLRTHVLRPTWHLLLPDDARWLLELSAPRVHQANGNPYRTFGVDERFDGATEALAEATADGATLTRAEAAEVLAARGTPASGLQLGYVLMRAELDRALVSGPLRGKQRTYAAFDERVPAGYGPLGSTFDRDAALAELVRRYLVGRAYATVKDVAVWSGMTLGDVRHALGLLADEVASAPGAGDLEGLELWHLTGEQDPAALPGAPEDAGPEGPVIDLLQSYDELFMGYGESRGVAEEPGSHEAYAALARPFIHAITVDGRVAGRWKSTLTTRSLVLETQWYREPAPAEAAGLREAGQELAAYFGVALRE